MIARNLVSVAMGLMLALLVAGAASGHDAAYSSHVTLRVEGNTVFSGRVRSDLHACEAHRRVKLYRQQPGPDQFIQEGTTDSDGRYEINTTPTFATYYTRALRKVIDRPGHHHVCRRAKSNTVEAL